MERHASRMVAPSGTVTGAPSIVIGPGTGLGVAGYIPGAHGPVVLATEGGAVLEILDHPLGGLLESVPVGNLLSGENTHDGRAQRASDTNPVLDELHVFLAALRVG